jgi:pyroglutamyl-peptidase
LSFIDDLMHALRGRKRIRGGFNHVPFLPEQARHGQPSRPLDVKIEIMDVSMDVALATRRDRKSASDATH